MIVNDIHQAYKKLQTGNFTFKKYFARHYRSLNAIKVTFYPARGRGRLVVCLPADTNCMWFILQNNTVAKDYLKVRKNVSCHF